MMSESTNLATGYLILSFLTWSAMFAVLVFGFLLRGKILRWDEHWKETIEESGVKIEDYADDLQRTFEKIRATFRWLGFFLIVFLCLMVWLVYQGTLEKPILGMPYALNGLWTLSLLCLSAIVPAMVNFAVGTYVAENMLLKANSFVFHNAKEEMKEKKAKLKMMEQARLMKEKREELKIAAQTAATEAAVQAAGGKPGTPAKPAGAK